MKKFLFTALALATTGSAFAETAKVQLVETQLQPKLAINIFEQTNNGVQLTNKTSISRSSTKEQLCWTAFDLVLPHQVDVEEVFISPARTVFNNAQSRSHTSADGLQHIVQSSLKSANNSAVSQCWRFDKTDPVGTYQLTLRVGNIAYPTYTFEVTK